MGFTKLLGRLLAPTRLVSCLALLSASASLILACSSDSNDGTASPGAGGATGATCTDGGGPVPGDTDMHCTDADGNSIVQETTAAACMDASAGGDEGAGGASDGEEEEEQLTLFNAEGDDDDCKYHVTFGSTCVEKNKDVTLTLHANLRTDDSALAGADPEVEIYLSDTHLAPNTHPKTTVVSDGVYTIGPVRFDQSGRWTVRFHLFETCLDAREDSPHGHVAFYVDVP